MNRIARFLMASAAFAAVLAIAMPADAQCNSANGQCGAPNVSLGNLQSQAFQQQLNNAVTSASASSAAPAAPVVAQPQQFVYQYAPAAAYAGQVYATPAYAATAVAHPSMMMFALPAPAKTANAAAEDVAENGEQAENAFVAPIFQLAAFPAQVAASGGAAASASASSAAPQQAAIVQPALVNPGLASASVSSSGCASGNCGRGKGLGLGVRFAARRAIRRAARNGTASVAFTGTSN